MRRRLYAAIDLHSRTSVLGWMGGRGKMIDTIRFETSEDNLREKVGALRAKEIHLTIEAAPLARWAAGILRPLVTRLIVCDARRNRLVSCAPNKDDEVDTESLCRLVRLEELHEVWMSNNEARQIFREAVFDLLKLRDRQRELKTLIKNRFRTQGVLRLNGTEIFHPVKRRRWIDQLSDTRRHGLLVIYGLFDSALAAWRGQLREVRRLGSAFPEIARFREVPGVGEIGAAVFCAIIEDPHRFKTDSQLYRYSALGITSRSSDNKPLGYERLERRGQRELKNLSYHAWRTGIRSGSQCDVVRRFYLASKQRTGSARHARLNTQRKILKTLLRIWRNNSRFEPKLFLQNPTPQPATGRRRRGRPRRSRSRKG